MVARLVLGIFSVVFLPLGAVFVVIGLTVDDIDRGDPVVFLYIGVPFALIGVGSAVAFVVLWRRERARRRRRRAGLRTRAEIVRADPNWNVRVNGRPAVLLTIRLPGGDVSGTFISRRGQALTPGDSIEVMYDPMEPSNFEPVT